MESTADSTLPLAVMMTSSMSGRLVLRCRTMSSPFRPSMSRKRTSTFCASINRIACSADSHVLARYPRVRATSRHASRTERSSSTINKFSNVGDDTGAAAPLRILGAIAAVIKHLCNSQECETVQCKNLRTEPNRNSPVVAATVKRASFMDSTGGLRVPLLHACSLLWKFYGDELSLYRTAKQSACDE